MLSKTHVKYIQSLVHKKFREQYGQYIIEGPKLLSEAMNGDISSISRIYASPEWLDKPGFPVLPKGIEIITVSEADMKTVNNALAKAAEMDKAGKEEDCEKSLAPAMKLVGVQEQHKD